MWALELVFETIFDLMLHAGPRWMRLGCTILLAAVVLGLLSLALYAWIFL
jgi:hypothetical protein